MYYSTDRARSPDRAAGQKGVPPASPSLYGNLAQSGYPHAMNHAWGYVAVFLGGLAVDSIPVFAPPAWMFAVFVVTKWGLHPWLAAGFTAAGSTIGRGVLSRYMPKLTGRIFNRRENDNIAFLGKKLGGKYWTAFTFTLLYSLTPLSTTALFTAAGTARVDLLPILPAFLLGKFVSDGVMIAGGRRAVRGFEDILHGNSSPQSIATAALGIVLIATVLFIDWRTLLERRELRFQFRILKGRG